MFHTGQKIFVFLLIIFCSFQVTARPGFRPASMLTAANDNNLLLLENKGQITDQRFHARTDIDFKLDAGDINIFIGAGAIYYQWAKYTSPGNQTGQNKIHKTEMVRLDMMLEGANLQAEAIPAEIQPYIENHYTANLQNGAIIRSYKQVRYNNIYPGIDWLIYISNGKLKYDFIVHPGGNPKDIRLRYNGADAIKLQEGAITISTTAGSITEQQPYTYEQETGNFIPSAYIRNGNTIQFELATSSKTIVIDPELAWATYYGTDPVVDYSNGLGTDQKGNVYLGGTTYSRSNIATTGAHKTVLTSSSTDVGDAFVVKFDAEGNRQWATYYGGREAEELSDIAVSATGDVYLAGLTFSDTGIATPGSHQVQYGGGVLLDGDVFLVKFNTSGLRLWGTYYGGFMRDDYAKICLDGEDNILLSGNTSSANDIASANAFQPVINGGQDGFVVKFNKQGTRLWATYCGGNMYHESIETIACDGDGNIFVAGFTTSDAGLATPGTHQTVFNPQPTPNTTDGFIVKLDAQGNKLWGTYYGGDKYDYIDAIVCDWEGNVFIGGNTNSANKIATPISFQPTLGGTQDDEDGFLAALSPTGNLFWSTYYGGGETDEISSLSLDNMGNIYAGGRSKSDNMTTPGSMQPARKGDADVFVAVFDRQGNRKTGTYYGGENFEMLVALHLDRRGNLFLTGNTSSTSGIATPGAFKSVFSHTSTLYDAFLAKIVVDTTVFFDQFFTRTDYCAGDTFSLAFGTSMPYQPGNSFYVQLSDSDGYFSAPTIIGAQQAQTGGTIHCAIPGNIPSGAKYRMRLIASDKPDTSFDNGINIRIGNVPSVTASSNSPICEGDSLMLSFATDIGPIDPLWFGPDGSGITGYFPLVTNAKAASAGDYVLLARQYGCIRFDTVSVEINVIPDTPFISSNSPVCEGGSLHFSAVGTSGTSFQWSGPNSFTSATKDPFIASASMAAYGIYTVTATSSGCTAPPVSYTAVVKPLPTMPQPASNSPVCEDDSLWLNVQNPESGIQYHWSGPNGFTAPDARILIPKATTEHAGAYLLTAVLNGCPRSEAVSVSIKSRPRPQIFSNAPIYEDDQLELSVSGTAPGTNYLWTGPDGFVANQQHLAIPNATQMLAGSYTVTTERDGCKATASTLVLIFDRKDEYLVLYPSPNNGLFTIKANLQTLQNIPFQILTATGQLVHKDVIYSVSRTLEKEVDLKGRLASGIYYFRISLNGKTRNIPFEVHR